MTETELDLNDRILALCDGILKEDWTPDKAYPAGKGGTVKYVTLSKLTRQTAPILKAVGLTLTCVDENVEILKPIGVKDNHVYLTCVFTLSDGKDKRDYKVIAEGADTADKALSFAHSYAKRLFWTQNFPIVDGLEDIIESPLSSADVTANLMRRAITEDPVVVSNADKGEPAEEKEGDTVKASGPLTSPGDSNLSPIQIRAMDNALEVIEQADKEGRILHQHAVTAREIRAKASCKEDVTAIMELRKELGL